MNRGASLPTMQAYAEGVARYEHRRILHHGAIFQLNYAIAARHDAFGAEVGETAGEAGEIQLRVK